MKDCRENLYTDFRDILIQEGIAPEGITRLLNAVVLRMDRYEIIERCTDMVSYSDNSEDLLKLYAGTLLTEGKSQRTVTGYLYLLKRFHCDTGKPLADISTMDIRLWLAQRQVKTSPVTCRNYRNYLSAFYIWLTEEGYIDKNPMARVKQIKCPLKVKRPFSQVEIDRIRCSFSNKQKRERAIFEFLLASGVRANELCNIRIDDIDFGTKQVTVREAKGGNQRIVCINDIALEHLKDYLQNRKYQSVYAFCKNGADAGMLSARNLEGMFRTIGKRTGIKKVHPHRCRRTFATELSRKGMNIRSIQQLMGHREINTTTTYIQLETGQVRVEYEMHN